MSHLIAMETRQNKTADDLRKLVNEVRVENKVIQDENKALHGQFERLMSVVVSQQRQLKNVWMQKRDPVTWWLLGYPKMESTSTRLKRIKVFDKVCPGDEFTYTAKRLGDPRQDNNARPVLVTLPSSGYRRGGGGWLGGLTPPPPLQRFLFFFAWQYMKIATDLDPKPPLRRILAQNPPPP